MTTKFKIGDVVGIIGSHGCRFGVVMEKSVLERDSLVFWLFDEDVANDWTGKERWDDMRALKLYKNIEKDDA